MTRTKKTIITVAIAWLFVLPFVVYWMYYMMHECSPQQWQREYWEGLTTAILFLSTVGLVGITAYVTYPDIED